MDGQIKVTPEKLKETSSEFGSLDSQITSLTGEMRTLVKGLASNWEGTASAAYIRQFTGLQNDMDQMHRKIQEHVKDLTDMATVYENAEKQNESTNSAIPSDLIK